MDNFESVYQNAYIYTDTVSGIQRTYESVVVYPTEELATKYRLRDWAVIEQPDDELLNITTKLLILLRK